MSDLPLSAIGVGSRAVVTGLSAGNPVRRRLLEMGFVPGREVNVRSKAAFGGPIVCEVLGYRLAMRREHAAQIRVRPTTEEAP